MAAVCDSRIDKGTRRCTNRSPATAIIAASRTTESPKRAVVAISFAPLLSLALSWPTQDTYRGTREQPLPTEVCGQPRRGGPSWAKLRSYERERHGTTLGRQILVFPGGSVRASEQIGRASCREI